MTGEDLEELRWTDPEPPTLVQEPYFEEGDRRDGTGPSSRVRGVEDPASGAAQSAGFRQMPDKRVRVNDDAAPVHRCPAAAPPR